MADLPIKARVVLVDDNDVTRTLMRGMLVGDRYEIAGEANNGESGLDKALLHKPDLVCLDIDMPKMSGLEVLKQLKAQLPHTAVVMVTGSKDRDTVQDAIQAGADGYVVKPFNSARVLDTVSAALSKARAKKEAAAKETAKEEVKEDAK